VIDPELRDDDAATATDAVLRQFAGLCLTLFGGVAVIELMVRHRTGRAAVCALIAAAIGSVGLVRPRAISFVFQAAMAVATPIGWVVSHVLLAAIYYGLFAPVSFCFRLVGRDSLARRGRKHVDTYWAVKRQPSDLQSYLRQS
jgi:polyferredoxin